MPKYNIDYSKGQIYKLVSNDVNDKNIYVGSTTNFLDRKSQHKGGCNNSKSKVHNFKVYQHIRENGGWINWQMILVESYPCASKLEMLARERYHYETLGATLNGNIPGRERSEWRPMYRAKNLPEIKRKANEYYEKNSMAQNERRRLHDSQNRAHIAERVKRSKIRVKERNARILLESVIVDESDPITEIPSNDISISTDMISISTDMISIST
jgi:hypothetical protein